jgi:hypothetical protein
MIDNLTAILATNTSHSMVQRRKSLSQPHKTTALRCKLSSRNHVVNLLTLTFWACLGLERGQPEDQRKEEGRMSTLQIALIAFTAGFLSCVALVMALVWRSFADHRVSGIKSVTGTSRVSEPR